MKKFEVKRIIWIAVLCVISAPVFAQSVFDKTADWTLEGADNVKAEGNVEFADGVYTLQGNGNDIWGNADEGFYAYTEKSGSWSISAKIDWNDTGTNDWSKIGVMIRDNGELPESRHYSVLARGGPDGAQDGTYVQMRQQEGQASRGLDAYIDGAIAPSAGGIYVRVSRYEPMDLFWTEVSFDGNEWRHVHTNVLDFEDPISVGVAITSHTGDDLLVEGTAEDVVIEEVTEVPEDVIGGPVGDFEHHADVGDFRWDSIVDYSDGTYVIEAGGADIWGNDDDFHYVYNEMTGSFEAEGSYFVIGVGTDWSRAGFMVRQNLSWSSPHVMVTSNSVQLTRLNTRETFEGSVSNGSVQIPFEEHQEEFKIVKVGNTIEGFYKNLDGDWVSLGASTIEIEDPFLFGLAVGSHSGNSGPSIGEFSDITITEYPFGIVRDFDVTAMPPGSSEVVTVTLNIREGETLDVTIVENYPEGTNVSGISASSGETSDDGSGALTWTLTGASGVQTLTYSLNVEEDAPETGTLSGTYESPGFSGSSGSKTVLFRDTNPDVGDFFQGHMDIGSPGADGGVIREDDTWKVLGSGNDIWGTADNFHFLYFKAEGDFEMTIDEPYIGAFSVLPSSNDWQKMGIMARDELTPSSAYAYANLRSSDQDFMLQWRESDGAEAAWDGDGTLVPGVDWNPNWDSATESINNPAFDEVSHGGTIKLIREGDDFLSAFVFEGEEFINNVHTVEMTDPIYVGIAVTSHETGSLSQGVFKNPQFTGNVVSVSNWMLH